ncbi:MAG: efflux RND transporter periplasmic adaptor subunit [Chthoniobacter sp.]
MTARSTDVGALIQSSGDTSSAKELFHLADNHILRIYFSVPEVYAATVKHDEEAAIAFDAFPGEKFTGKLIRDSAALDPLSHTLNVEADVENPSGRLFPGGYATVHLKIPGTPPARSPFRPIPCSSAPKACAWPSSATATWCSCPSRSGTISATRSKSSSVSRRKTPWSSTHPIPLADGEAARVQESAPAKPAP